MTKRDWLLLAIVFIVAGGFLQYLGSLIGEPYIVIKVAAALLFDMTLLTLLIHHAEKRRLKEQEPAAQDSKDQSK